MSLLSFSQFAGHISWALIHSLCQFALVALLSCIVAKTVRHNANLKYSIYCFGLVCMGLCCLITISLRAGFWKESTPSIAASVGVPFSDGLAESADPSSDEITQTQLSVRSHNAAEIAADVPLEDSQNLDSADDSEASPSAWLSSIFYLWAVGTILFGIRPLLSWLNVRHLLKTGAVVEDVTLRNVLVRIKQRLNVRSNVRLLESKLLVAPILIGYFKPTVMLPASLISNLSIKEIEAVVAHELAHVRRHDFLINVFQLLAESLFFYHPAVWWISRQIRAERENCCDEMVVRSFNNHFIYGRTLLRLEEFAKKQKALAQNAMVKNEIALGMADSGLVARVKRLHQLQQIKPRQKTIQRQRIAGSGIVAFALAVAFVLSVLWGTAAKGIAGAGLAQDLTCTISVERQGKQRVINVELENTSNQPQAVLGKPEFVDDHIQVLLSDAQGEIYELPTREYVDERLLPIRAKLVRLDPGDSHSFKLSTGDRPLDFRVEPGEYEIQVIYRGPNADRQLPAGGEGTDNAFVYAWRGECKSNKVKLDLREADANSLPTSNALAWGEAKDGLQVAFEFVAKPGTQEAKALPNSLPSKPSVQTKFWVRNVAQTPIQFVSETGRQGDSLEVFDENGKRVSVSDTFFTGWPVFVRWTLAPGQVVELDCLSSPIHSLWKPGDYTLQYLVRLSFGAKEGDFNQDLKTGKQQLAIIERDEPEVKVASSGEIVGYLRDHETNEPIAGATVSAAILVNQDLIRRRSKSGGVASAKTDAQGKYRIVVPSPGYYSVFLKSYRKDWKTARADCSLQVDAGRRTNSSLRLMSARNISGILIDENGQPVSGAVVRFKSPSRPFSQPQGVRSKSDGSFLFRSAAGHGVLTASIKDDDNGERKAAVNVAIPEFGKCEPVELQLRAVAPWRIGSTEWVSETTVGSEVLSQGKEESVTGRVLGADGKPIQGAVVYTRTSEPAETNESGSFTIKSSRQTQFVMYASAPGYCTWVGTPASGDELKIVLNSKVAPSKFQAVANPASSENRKLAAKNSGESGSRSTEEIKLPDHLNIVDVQFDPTSGKLYSFSTEKTAKIRVWDSKNKKMLREVALDTPLHGNKFLFRSRPTFSKDCRYVATAVSGQVAIWDSNSGKRKLETPGNETVAVYAISPDFKFLLCADGSFSTGFGVPDCRLMLFSIDLGNSTIELIDEYVHKSAVQIQSVAVSADGKQIASGSQSGELLVFDTSTKQLVWKMKNELATDAYPHEVEIKDSLQQVLALEYSPDGSRLAMGTLLGVKLLNAEDGKELRWWIRPYRYGAGRLRFDATGSMLARFGTDAGVDVWHTPSGRFLARIATSSLAGAFSPDARKIAIGSSDRKQALSIWDVLRIPQ